jgi:hypothetical protein
MYLTVTSNSYSNKFILMYLVSGLFWFQTNLPKKLLEIGRD